MRNAPRCVVTRASCRLLDDHMPMTAYPESSFTFRIVWFYQWGGVVFTSQCWRVFGSTCTVLCVRSFILSAASTDRHVQSEGTERGFKRRSGWRWVSWRKMTPDQTHLLSEFSGPAKALGLSPSRGVSRMLASLIAPVQLSHHCHKKYKPSITCLSLKV